MKIPLFDNDGTLLVARTNYVHDHAFNEALRTVYHLPNADVHEVSTRGKIDPEILIEISTLHGITGEQAQKLLPQAFAVMVKYFEEHKHEGTPKAEKGVIELLQLMREQTHVGVLTGNIEQIGWGKLGQAGLKKYIEFGAFGSLALKRVDLIKIAQERYEQQFHEKKSLNNFVIVGDTPKDIECARDGGVMVIAVATGKYTKEELKEADLVVNSLEESDKIITFLSQ